MYLTIDRVPARMWVVLESKTMRRKREKEEEGERM
jgi:hypothetical protein